MAGHRFLPSLSSSAPITRRGWAAVVVLKEKPSHRSVRPQARPRYGRSVAIRPAPCPGRGRVPYRQRVTECVRSRIRKDQQRSRVSRRRSSALIFTSIACTRFRWGSGLTVGSVLLLFSKSLYTLDLPDHIAPQVKAQRCCSVPGILDAVFDLTGGERLVTRTTLRSEAITRADPFRQVRR